MCLSLQPLGLSHRAIALSTIQVNLSRVFVQLVFRVPSSLGSVLEILISRFSLSHLSVAALSSDGASDFPGISLLRFT